MNIDSLANQIAIVERSINTIEKSIQSVDSSISRKAKEANGILAKISKEKDLRRLVSLQKDLAKKNDEVSKLEKSKTNKSKVLAEKKKKKLELQSKINKEEQKVRDKVKKDQKEILSIQQQINQEIEKQKDESLIAIDNLQPQISQQINYDVFVSHASEDKEDFVRDFVTCLKENGLKVWYDEFTLRIGDSLRRSIDNGLRDSKYGIVVLSEAFFKKEWPQRELDGLFAREINGEKVILPIWHKISKNEVLQYSPIVADMLAINTTNFTIEEIAREISQRVLS